MALWEKKRCYKNGVYADVPRYSSVSLERYIDGYGRLYIIIFFILNF